MTIVFFSNDLMFQSRMKSVVERAGIQLIVARKHDGFQSKLSEGEAPSLAVFDLSFRGINLESAVAHLREQYPAMKLIAYGPHVDVDALQQASDLGIDEVMTRGQFDRNLSAVLIPSSPDSRD